jgi:hypothetical protein
MNMNTRERLSYQHLSHLDIIQSISSFLKGKFIDCQLKWTTLEECGKFSSSGSYSPAILPPVNATSDR